MATIKAFTDVSQSKKLAEILSIESADNVIVKFGDREGTKTVIMPKETLDVIRTPFADIRKVIPCWSLTALLIILPNYNIVNNGITGVVVWSLDTYSNEHQNLIDSCVDLILKLHKQNLL